MSECVVKGAARLYNRDGGQREIADKAVVNARQVKLMLNQANEVRNLVNARDKQRVKLSEAG